MLDYCMNSLLTCRYCTYLCISRFGCISFNTLIANRIPENLGSADSGEKELFVYLDNIRSIRSNSKTFLLTLRRERRSPQVLVLTETWIYSWEEHLNSIECYNLILVAPAKKSSGFRTPSLTLVASKDLDSIHKSDLLGKMTGFGME